MNNSRFTPAQDAAIKRAYQLLAEHFDTSVIVVAAEVDLHGRATDISRTFWAGGYYAAIGALHSAQRNLANNQEVNRDYRPEEP